MSTITLNGQPCTTLAVTIPKYGAWAADMGLATSSAISPQLTIQAGNLSLSGTARRMASFSGTQTTRAVAGGGGWRKVIGPKGYSHSAGVKASTVISDAAREAGETVGVFPDRILGESYVREQAKASRVLKTIMGGSWWVDTKGVTQFVARDASPIVTPFTVSQWLGGKGRFEIATEDLASWMPGRSFSSPTAKGPSVISSTTIVSDNDGKLRLLVLTEDADQQSRIHRDIRAMIVDELADVISAGIWEYTVESGDDTKLDATPVDPRMPAIADCPMFPGLLGEKVTPAPGSRCYIAFLNLDRAKPICVGIEGDALEASIKAVLIKLGAGARPAIGAGDLAGGIWPCVPTQAEVLI